jgi:hypothetical protein
MLKHFDVWPTTLNKNDLFEEQKIFLIYLLGIIPERQDWNINIEYQKQLQEIKDLKHIELEQTEIDLAKIQGKSLQDIEKEKLKEEKKKQIHELKEKFGVKEEIEKNYFVELPEKENISPYNHQQKLWDILHGKGLLNKKTDKNNGLQYKN